MAASFRNTEEIKGIVGCDLMTIRFVNPFSSITQLNVSPALLGKLSEDSEKIKPVLTVETGNFF